jgi:peptide/nickel transport system permease protein
MTAANIAEVAPSLPLRLQMRRPRPILALILLMWIPLTAYVMFGSNMPETTRNVILLPAIPATLALYYIAVTSWRESPIAVIGATLVFFWLLVAVTAPYLPLIDPNKPIKPFAPIGAYANNHLFLLGADFKGRDMLSRDLWGCQRVLVWGVSATLVA